GPGLLEIPDRLTAPVEHQRSNADVAVLLKQARLPAPVNQLCEVTFQHHGTATAGLGRFGPEPDGAGFTVHVGPLQGDDFALPPAREVGEPSEVPEVVGYWSRSPFRPPG